MNTLRNWLRRRRLPLAVASQLFVVFVCGAVLITQIAESYHSREMALHDGQVDAVNLSRSVARHLDDCFDIADIVLTGMVTRVESEGRSTKSLAGLHETMRIWADSTPLIEGIYLFDEHGNWLANSMAVTPAPYAISDRPAFKYHQSHTDTATRVDTVTRSRSSNQMILIVSRRYNMPDGSFGGMVSVGISMDYFQSYLSRFDIGPLGVRYVASTDRRKNIVRVPDSDVIDRVAVNGRLWQFAAKAPEGVWTAQSPIDNVVRITSYKVSEKYPVVVGIAIAEDDILSAWRVDARNQLIRSLLLCLLIAVLGQALTRHFRRRQQAEQAVRQRESALHALFERTTDYLVVHDVRAAGDFPISQLNSPAAAALGLNADDAIGRSLREFPELQPLDDYEEALRRCMAQRGKVRIASTVKQGGRVNYWEITFTPMIEDSGRIDRILVTSRDITHLKRKEAEVTEANRLLLLAEQVGRFGHWRLELPGRKLTWSDEIYRMLGLDPAEFSPSFPLAWSRYHPEDVPFVRAALDGAINRGVNYEVNMRVLLDDGGQRWVSSRAICETDEQGNVTAVFGVFRDLTEVKEREQAMRDAKETAEAMTRARSEFLSTMSHELRTPLTGVLGMIDLLKSQSSGKETGVLLDTMKLSAEGLLSILSDILDFSKIESGMMVLESIEMRVSDVVSNVIGLFSPVATKRGLTLSWACESETYHQMVMGDPTRLRQVLSNLVSNAIKFTSHGNVALRVFPPTADADGVFWRFEVEDTGIGLDEAMQEHLFDPFSQADASITRRYGGTGLGLAISKRIVEAMGGQIGVISTVGTGSVFWFEVRLEPVAIIGSTETGRADPMRLTDFVLKILIAEDNSVNQMLIMTMLRNMGHEATCVANGRLALESVQAEDYDLVLMDMQMPEMDGASATRAIRRLPTSVSALPIVGLTADTLPEHVEAYMEAGLSGFLPKPINLSRLRGALDEIVAALPEHRRRRPTGAPIIAEIDHPLQAVAESPVIVVAADGMAALDEPFSFDRRRLEDLRGSIGAPTTIKLLNSFTADIEKRVGELRSAALEDDKSSLSAIAHAISGASANLGAIRLAGAASGLGKALRDGENYAGWLKNVEIAASSIGAAVHQLENGQI